MAKKEKEAKSSKKAKKVKDEDEVKGKKKSKAKAEDEPKGKKKKAKAEDDEPKKKKGKKSKAEAEPEDEEEEEDEPRKGKKGKVKEASEFFDANAMIDSQLDGIAKRLLVTEGAGDPGDPMSSGNLSLDIVYGGGIKPAWYTHFGPEQSCKTTGTIALMAAAIKAQVGVIGFRDYEGSTANSMDYVSSILKTQGVKATTKEVFGEKDPKTGNWIVRPIVRYAEESVGERFFDWLAALLQAMPEKRRIGSDWWLRYEDNKQNASRIGSFAEASMSKKYGKGLWVPSPNGALQGLIIVDSYPAMNPEANDDEEANNSLALQARMFSKHLPRVKGKLSGRRVAVVGVNQLRDVPMAMYGPKEKEPGGQALRFNSDVRLKFAPRALSAAPFGPKTGKDMPDELEDSVQYPGTKDQYRYILVTGVKNKLGQPGRKMWIRVWVEDGAGNAQGFDPFFDTMNYLRSTGQLIGNQRHKITLNIDGIGKTKSYVPWKVLKTWVLGDKKEMRAICEKLGFKPINLRNYCFKQIADGTAERLYTEAKNSKSKDDEEEE